jgi:hypothetical protein
MGIFSNKIVAEFTPPKTWMLEDELAFETNELKDEDIEVLIKIGANIVDTGRDTGRITCRKGMKTDLASVPRICWAVISPWDVARAAIIHDHLYAALRSYCDEVDYSYNVWKRGKDLSDIIFLLGMKSADPKVPCWKMYPAYWAVRLFGRWSAK